MVEPGGRADYPYKGLPLTPNIIEELILELFKGRLEERQVIVDEILQAHLSRGGAKPRAEDLPRSVKKALADLQARSLAENPSHGFWRIRCASPESIEGGADSTEQPSREAGSEGPATGSPPPRDIPADAELGQGSGAVYLYYLPSYRQLAEQRGEKVWKCKIGRTDRDPVTRVLSQAATALPERPHIALILRTSEPSAWEAALHGALTLRGRKSDDAPGSEWFLTSPSEVLELATFLDPRIEAGRKS